jgi:hypothetical protein
VRGSHLQIHVEVIRANAAGESADRGLMNITRSDHFQLLSHHGFVCQRIRVLSSVIQHRKIIGASDAYAAFETSASVLGELTRCHQCCHLLPAVDGGFVCIGIRVLLGVLQHHPFGVAYAAFKTSASVLGELTRCHQCCHLPPAVDDT